MTTGSAEDRWPDDWSHATKAAWFVILAAFALTLVTALVRDMRVREAARGASHLVTVGTEQFCSQGTPKKKTGPSGVEFIDAKTGSRVRTALPVTVEYDSDECAQWRKDD